MVFRPLAGCGLFPSGRCLRHGLSGVSVPLRGVGCFQVQTDLYMPRLVSVPLRGVGCFKIMSEGLEGLQSFRPLAGCGLFPDLSLQKWRRGKVSVPLRGVGCFASLEMEYCWHQVSVPLRGVGCFGKAAHSFWRNRKKNCQLCYFIVSYWQMFINSKLRNCKVPCEAHKTAT